MRTAYDAWREHDRYEDMDEMDRLIVDEYEAEKEGERADAFEQAREMEDEHIMSELDKLQTYLENNGYKFKRIDTPAPGETHQIVVYGKEDQIAWDAICFRGSYGYEAGLLEIMGAIVDPVKSGGDTVEGWLTAQDIIDRLERGGQNADMSGGKG